MADNELPVTIAVRRSDGSVEQVRVGSAWRQGEGFTIRLQELSIGGATTSTGAAPRAASRASSSSGGGSGAVFPPYGRSKGAPIFGATTEDLEYYAAGSRRSLADPAKQRWHEKERELLAAIEAEMARQGVPVGSGRARARPNFGEEPPAPAQSSSGFEPPPHSDDDIPF
jgi:hypothetical protein